MFILLPVFLFVNREIKIPYIYFYILLISCWQFPSFNYIYVGGGLYGADGMRDAEMGGCIYLRYGTGCLTYCDVQYSVGVVFI